MNSYLLDEQILTARSAQTAFAISNRAVRVALLESYANALQAVRERLVAAVVADAKKTVRDADVEVGGAIDIIGKTIRDTNLPELNDMQRERVRPPVGVVGLITSFNFPIAVAHWTIAPAILAGNAVLWKPSEKTPAVAHLCKELWNSVAGEYAGLLQIISGNREVGAAMVAHEGVDMISATGSVAMGEAITKTLAVKKNNAVPPILELGGNNAVVIAEAMTDAHLTFAVKAVFSSFLASTGQRCTNTRRVFVHSKWANKFISEAEQMLTTFIKDEMHNPDNSYNYRELIDADAVSRFATAKAQALKEGGKIMGGGDGEPALAIMPAQTGIMHTETFAPLLYIASYEGDVAAAMQLVNAPENAGLVNGIYTLSKQEAAQFAALNEAGHSVINSPKGTGTPAFGMGFGGNKASGSGEILWGADPLAAFTRAGPVRRVATHTKVLLQTGLFNASVMTV